VLSKTDIRKFTNARGEGQFFKVDLSDASGTTSGTFFGRAADMFYQSIQVGQVYVFSRGSVKAGNPRFDSSAYVINFEERSLIEPAGEDSAIPGITYEFKPLADIEQSPPGTLLDIRAVVYSAGEATTFTARSTNKEHTKRDVGLWDGSGADGGCFVDLALWGERAQQGGFEVGAVVFLKRARVGEYQGVKNLSSPSSFEINPDHPEAFALLAQFEALRSRGGVVMPTPRLRSSTAAGGRKTIEAMKQEDLNLGPPPVYGQVLELGGPRSVHRHHLVATVTQIPNDRMPCYPACPEQVSSASGGGQRACSKKVSQESPSLWRCSAGHTCQAPVWRYLCKIEISDHTGSATVQLYDKQASALFGCDAHQCAQAWESDAAETIIQKALWKSVALRVRSQKEVWQEVERVKCSVDDLAAPAVTQEARAMLQEVYGSLQ
jgi:replication factor A1